MKAYSLHDREVGYCQGSAFIVGILLMQVRQSNVQWEIDEIYNKREKKQKNKKNHFLEEEVVVVVVDNHHRSLTYTPTYIHAM